MKCVIPEIAWHNREPVLSIAFQPGNANAGFVRLASGGADTHVLIWYVKEVDSNVTLEIACDLARHQRAVNVVRWSKDGTYLASGDDESVIIIWKQKTDVDPPPLLEQSNDQDREIWLQYKLLRGHLEDVYDISWCPFSNFLASGSVDNTVFMWDVHKGKSIGVLTDHKGFVQGVSWDPKNQHIATMSSDRVFRVFDISLKKVIHRVSKTLLPVPENHALHGQVYKLFYDDTLQSYFRRLDYSPDGELIAVPTGLIESEQNGVVKHINVAYIYKRTHMKSPVCILQCGESPSLVVSWCPLKYTLREGGPTPLVKFPTPMRFILAVATKTAVLLYDTQQTTPLAVISNIHYTRLTDLTWSADGQILVVSSTDGFCSVIKFCDGELGTPIVSDIISEKSGCDSEVVSLHNKENINVKDVTPIKKLLTPKSKNTSAKKNSTSSKKIEADDVVAIDETAMEPWAKDLKESPMKSKIIPKPMIKETSLESSEFVIDEQTEEMKLVYEDTQMEHKDESVKSIEKEAPVVPMEVKVEASKPLAPIRRRVNLITLSSPKNKKKQ